MVDYSAYTPLATDWHDVGAAACASVTICRIFEMGPHSVVDSSPAQGLHYYIETSPCNNVPDDALWYNYKVNGEHVGNRNGCVRVVMHMLLEWQRAHVISEQPAPEEWPQLQRIVLDKIAKLWPLQENGDHMSYYYTYTQRVDHLVYAHGIAERRGDAASRLGAVHRLVAILDDLTHLEYVRAKYPQHSFDTIVDLASRNDPSF